MPRLATGNLMLAAVKPNALNLSLLAAFQARWLRDRSRSGLFRGGVRVPIYRLLQNSAFTPEHIQAMGTAFEEALAELGLVYRDDPIAELVAKQIIQVAQRPKGI